MPPAANGLGIVFDGSDMCERQLQAAAKRPEFVEALDGKHDTIAFCRHVNQSDTPRVITFCTMSFGRHGRLQLLEPASNNPLFIAVRELMSAGGNTLLQLSLQGRTTLSRPASLIGFRELTSARVNALLQLFLPIEGDFERRVLAAADDHVDQELLASCCDLDVVGLTGHEPLCVRGEEL